MLLAFTMSSDLAISFLRAADDIRLQMEGFPGGISGILTEAASPHCMAMLSSTRSSMRVHLAASQGILSHSLWLGILGSGSALSTAKAAACSISPIR